MSRYRCHSFQTYPWIDPRIEQIDDDHHQYQKRTIEHRRTHDDTVIALLYCKYEGLSETGNAEDVLNDESAGRDRRDRWTQHGNYRKYRVSQLVSREDLCAQVRLSNVPFE